MKKRYFYIGNILIVFLIFLLYFSLNTKFINKIDMATYQFISQFISETNTKIFKVITFLGSFPFVFTVSVIIVLFLKRNYNYYYGGAIISSMILSNLLKVLIKRPRPAVLKLVIENTYSFPSGHTIAITTLTGFLILFLWLEKGRIGKKLRYALSVILSLIALLVMISRIYLGAHYLTDVLGGILCTTLVLFNITYLLKKQNSPT